MASHPPRLKDFPYIGKYYYFLTFCTEERRQVFVTAKPVDSLVAQLRRSSREYDMAIHAYSVMPDHAHLLSQGTCDTSDLRAFMIDLKQQTGWDHKKETGGRLWQGSYYDHVLRPEEGTAGVIAYIVNNPVEGGLASRAEDYPFWGSFVYSREELLEKIKGAGLWTPAAVVSP